MDVVKIAKELVALNSENPPADVRAVGGYIYDFLKEIGRKPVKQSLGSKERFNVLSIGTGNLLINGHMDTVSIGDRKSWHFNPFGELRNQRLYGRGSADTKGNIACLLAALENEQERNLSLSFTAVEEIGFDGIYGVMKLRKTALRHIQYGITLEPTDGKIVNMNKGQYTFEIEAHGKAAHSSRPWLGENAIEKLVPCIRRLQAYARKLRKRTYKQLRCATLNVGLISGGCASNVVPDCARLVVDRRVLPNEKPIDVIREMTDVCKPLTIRVKQRIEPAETPAGAPIVRLLQRIHGAESLDAKLYGCLGTTELTAFRQNGIEGVVYGWPKLERAHTANEYAAIRELRMGKKILEKVVENAGN